VVWCVNGVCGYVCPCVCGVCVCLCVVFVCVCVVCVCVVCVCGCGVCGVFLCVFGCLFAEALGDARSTNTSHL